MSLRDVFQPPAGTLSEQRRARALDAARKSLPEFRRDDLTFGKFGVIEHDGQTYKIVRGLVDEIVSSSAVAFYVTKEGYAVYLERI